MSGNISSLNTAALATLERAINTALSMDARTRASIGALAGKSLKIDVTVPELCAFLLPENEGLRLVGHFEGRADCTVSGATSDFIALLLADDKPAALVNGKLKVSGDSGLLLALEKALSALDLDWEQRLSTLLGDVPAHQIGRFARGSAEFGRRARSSFERHLEEFIHEEARLAPPRAEVEDFFADVRALANRVARLEAGIRRLGRRMAERQLRADT
jgi:ubiquinone biosynthesis protein UbiJ